MAWKEIKKQVWEFGIYVIEKLNMDSLMELDKEYLNNKIYQFSLETSRSPASVLLGSSKKRIIVS